MAGALANTLNKLAQMDGMFSTGATSGANATKKDAKAFATPATPSLAQKISDMTKPASTSSSQMPGMTSGFSGSLASANFSMPSFEQATPSPAFGWSKQGSGQGSGQTKAFQSAWSGQGNQASSSNMSYAASPLASMLAGGPRPTSTATGGGGAQGGMASLGGKWAKVDSLNNLIQAAAQKTGVDANLIKAVMKLESNGEWIISHAGAIGYMQVVPKYWGHLDFDLNDPAENIMAGATVLKYYLDKNGGNVYEALRGYHGYGFDGFTTDRQYADVIMGNLQELRSAGGGSSGYTGTGSGWSVMFGGQAPNITQEMGLNSWSRQHLNGMYAYSPSLGITGHAGIDVGMTYGSSLYAPTGGTVIRSGGSGYYCDDSGCGPGQGELRIQLDNGDEIIIGHMSSISVKVGQRVNAGMFVGRSGSAGSGAHVHIEYRTPDRSTSSGWRVVDPRQALNGQVTAIGGGQAQQSGDPLTSWVNRFFGIGG